MKRYGKRFKLTDDLMMTIASYMNDEIREDLHFDLAPCTTKFFLRNYVKRDPEFKVLLKSEFGIEM